MKYISHLLWGQHGISLDCIFPLKFAIRTLAVNRRNEQIFESEAQITRAEVKKIVLDSILWVWSNLWLDKYYRELSMQKSNPSN